MRGAIDPLGAWQPVAGIMRASATALPLGSSPYPADGRLGLLHFAIERFRRRPINLLLRGICSLLLVFSLLGLYSSFARAQSGQPGFHESVVFAGLDHPTAFQFASDGRIFVAEKNGLILVFSSLETQTPSIFADLRANVDDSGNGGLLGMALAPGFPNVPYVYILYTHRGQVDGGRLSRLQAAGNVMTGAEQVLIEDWYQHYPDQPVGNLVFGPDGALYAGGGDGASSTMVDVGQTDNPSPDPPNEGGALRSQDLRTPADPVTLDGAIIRVRPDTAQPLRRKTSMTVGEPTIDANGVKSYSVTSVFQGSQPLTVRVLEPDNPAPGRPRRFLYVLPVEAGVTNLNSNWSDGLEELRLLDIPNRFNLTLIAPSFNYEPWYGDNVTDPTRRMESFIIQDLVPFGDSFATDDEIPQRFVLGFSKSGNGALFLILRHPNVFSAAAAWDAPAQLTNMSNFPNMLLNFGTEANFDNYEIPTLITTNAGPFTSKNRLWISGDDSAWTADMVQLHDQATAASIPHTWVRGGYRQHSWGSGWLDGAVTALDANAQSDAPVDVNEQRIIAYGLRSPRLTFRPGTQELWVADRGWNRSEEIDRISDATDGIVEDFGWPCYEGDAITDYSGSSICSSLYSQTSAVTLPYFQYGHQQQVVDGDDEQIGNGAVSGLAFYESGSYPAAYQGALFFSDYLRDRIWVMFKGGDGLPNPSTRANFLSGAASPVDIKTGPGGDLFYADVNGGTIRRISYSNRPQRSHGQPAGSLEAGTTQTTLSLDTDEDASCRYATAAGLSFDAMPNLFGITGSTNHSTTVTGLSDGNVYSYYVRCKTTDGHTNADDYLISFSVAQSGDQTPPLRSNGQPTGVLQQGTKQTTLSLSTDENATCRYASTPGVAFASMPNLFSNTGGMTHASTVSGLADGANYSFFVRCQDASSNANADDYAISFSVAGSNGASSSFVGSESPLREGGMWDTPGSWGALRKNNGAYAVDLLDGARLVQPVLGADQFAEITYDQDPGANSWVGVMTRVQGASNGSGYLAIAYAGQVRLYRTDDTGGLNFTLLASANAPVDAAPRRLRMESEGNAHRVYFNGVLMINLNEARYTTGQPGIAAAIFGGPTMKILTFEGGSVAESDQTPPLRSNGQPTGVLQQGTKQTTLSLSTDENATCRYASTPGVAFASMPNLFSNTGGMTHASTVSGLADGANYSFFVRCQDASSNANADDYAISFSVAGSNGASSSFVGSESPLREGGMWDTPGSWGALRKNNGAYAVDLLDGARLVQPVLGADQFAEITYDQDPGANSWVGVMTRVQGASNGSGYLAIAYAGQVRLYRTDDTGGLNFTLLASANAPVDAAPRRLRMESEGNAHRVYFNGVLMINLNEARYTTGQPGIAAAIFGGPTMKILTFEGGSVGQ
jgi:glucose/arabinose dehydrogenase/S-formylglutathione hydrolase FrmB